MANRSDFFNTSVKQPRLPRYLKKMLSMMDGTPEIRRMFTKAHLSHVLYRQKRNTNASNVDTSESPE